MGVRGEVGVTLLTQGTPEAVAARVRECIAEAGVGGGYVCSSSNSIHAGVRPDLYRTMVDAIHRDGRYPLAFR